MPDNRVNRAIFITLVILVSGLALVASLQIFDDDGVIPDDLKPGDPFRPGNFAQIEAGSFFMGTDENVAYPDEFPIHEVVISEPFLMGKTEITQEQWKTIMGNNPSLFQGRNRPVDNVSWDAIQAFIKKLNRLAKCGKCYRLPTEAEWEYAARAGTNNTYGFADSSDSLGLYAWFAENADYKTHQVGTKAPNAWGLHDMLGNVYEWVQDYYGPYVTYKTIDPKGLPEGTERVLRGGSWTDSARELRLTYRDYYAQNHRHNFFGFRLVRTTPFKKK